MASSFASEPCVAPAPAPAPVVEASGLGYAWPGAAQPSLADVDLRLLPGECVWLRGASGSGKSTLLRALAGVLPRGGRRRGSVRSDGRPVLLFQDVETQLLCTTAGEEVALGLRALGLAASLREARAADALAAVGLRGFERRTTDALSAGEKQRVVLAALLALEPKVLLLDEPASALDPSGRQALAGLLDDLKRGGHTLVVADHALGVAALVADRQVRLHQGRLCDEGAPVDGPVPLAPAAPPAPPAARPVLRGESLAVVDPRGRTLLDDVSLRAAAGERLLVTGPNGAGKSTLLRALVGLAPLARGRVRVAPETPGGVGLLFQNAHRHLFAHSVADEVAFALRRRGVPRRAARERVDEMLALCDLEGLRHRSPLRLSFGEQVRVALAAVLAPRPAALLLDEPFAGLDASARARLLDLLAREQARSGAVLLVATHDPRPWAGWWHRRARLAGGRLLDG